MVIIDVFLDADHFPRNVIASPTTEPPPPLMPTLSTSDFPALAPATVQEAFSPVEAPPAADGDATPLDLKAQERAQEKAERKAAKQAAAAEKAAERQRIAQEKAAVKAAEKARIAQEKAVEKEKADALKAQQEKEKAEKEKLAKEREKVAKEKEAKERAAKAEKDRLALIAKEKAAAIQAEKDKAAKKVAAQKETNNAKSSDKRADSSNKASSAAPSKATTTPVVPEPASQVPLLSKKPKKNKPITKPIRVPKEGEHIIDDLSTAPSATPIEAPRLTHESRSSSNNSRSQSMERDMPKTIGELLEEIHILNPTMDIPNHPFFDLHKVNPAAKMPLEYGPLVHALSALSVGGGSFANNVPSGSIDNAVSSFQQLLETLTQTISDLLRLLPRTTWDDSSSFDGVLRDMLKGDDFLDDGDDGAGKEDEVAALTLALERRARWMEVQLSKLEELHRDINTAAVKAVLAFNDQGWDRHGFMPRVGNTFKRFDTLGFVEEIGAFRPMTADELEKKLVVAKEAAVFAETEVRELMERMQAIKPDDDDM